MDYHGKLVRELQDGNADALFDLMSIYYKDFFCYGLRLTADSELTKDIIQQFIIHIWSCREKFREISQVEHYIFVAYKRFLIRQCRKEASIKLLQTDEFALADVSYEDLMIQRQQNSLLQSLLKQAVDNLPERQRQLIELRYFEHKGFDEIARITSLSVRTVYNTLFEALKKLRACKSLQQFYAAGLN